MSGKKLNAPRIGWRLGRMGPRMCVSYLEDGDGQSVAPEDAMAAALSDWVLRVCVRTEAEDGLASLEEIRVAAAWFGLSPSLLESSKRLVEVLGDDTLAHDFLAEMVAREVLTTEPASHTLVRIPIRIPHGPQHKSELRIVYGALLQYAGEYNSEGILASRATLVQSLIMQHQRFWNGHRGKNTGEDQWLASLENIIEVAQNLDSLIPDICEASEAVAAEKESEE